MKQLARFDSNHDDLIHGISYDFYGKRLVTCSSDQKLKVWDYRETKSSWELNENWKAHEASILKACWAHPEFGQVIASCSFDRSVRIWEELHQGDPTNPSNGSQSRRWVERARLVEARGAVLDIGFAPHHLGFKLATISSDGYLRIYEAMDIINLSQWTLMDEISLGANNSADSVGIKDPIQEGFCLSWCQSRFGPVQLAVGCGPEAAVKILRTDPDSPSRWSFREVLAGHEGPVHSVAWAPNPGRSYELIATGSKDRRVRVFKLSDHAPITTDPLAGNNGGGSIYFGSPFGESHQTPEIGLMSLNTETSPQAASNTLNHNDPSMTYHVTCVATIPDHRAEVWQVEFNILGTILASSGDDGKVRLFKATQRDDWRCLSVIASDAARPFTQSSAHGHPSNNNFSHNQNPSGSNIGYQIHSSHGVPGEFAG